MMSGMGVVEFLEFLARRDMVTMHSFRILIHEGLVVL